MKKFLSSLIVFSFLLILTPSATAITYYETIASTVLIEVFDSQDGFSYGSGFIISPDALILTAAHVIMDYETGEPAEYIDICFIETEFDTPYCMYSARVLAYDEDIDLAIIYPAYEIDEYGDEIGEFIEDATELYLPYTDFADTSPLLGDEIMILGFPGASGLSTVTLTSGAVSGFEMLFEDMIWKIMTDATINPGNSGGPAYNEDERVVGVVTEVSLTGVGGNYGYIISNDVILLWFLELVDEGILLEDPIYEGFTNDFIEDIEAYEFDNIEIFSDVDLSSSNSEAISYLKNVGIISGYPDGSFQPTKKLNRAELLKILVEGAEFDPDANIYKNCFPDVTDDWYARYVCFAKEQEWVVGYPDGNFKPNDNVNKVEALKMLLKALEVDVLLPTSQPYDDIDIKAWYGPFVFTAKYIGLLEETGSFYWPDAHISRGQISENIFRLLILAEDLERQAIVAVTADAMCLVGSEGYDIFGDDFDLDATLEADPDLNDQVENILEFYGFDDEEMLDAAAEKYEDDEEILFEILDALEYLCPEVLPDEYYL